MASPGPYFILSAVEAELHYQRTPPATYEGPEMKNRFGRGALEKKLGIKVSPCAAISSADTMHAQETHRDGAKELLWEVAMKIWRRQFLHLQWAASRRAGGIARHGAGHPSQPVDACSSGRLPAVRPTSRRG